MMQMQSIGLQSRPTGDRVAGHLTSSTPELLKERVVDAANQHHTEAPRYAQANTLAAAAAGLSNVGPLLEWNNIAANEVCFSCCLIRCSSCVRFVCPALRIPSCAELPVGCHGVCGPF